MSLVEGDLAEGFRRRDFDLLGGNCLGGSKVSRFRREDDLAEFFQRRVRDRLRGRCALARRGSEFDRRSCGVGGNFVSRLLMPG